MAEGGNCQPAALQEEKTIDCARRELEEETGLIAVNIKDREQAVHDVCVV